MKTLLLTLMFVAASFVPLSSAGESVKVLATYQARLSKRDHLDSKGKKLTTPAAILRRDRELGAPERIGDWELEDNPCDYFNSAAHRADFEKLLEHGHTSPTTYGAILTGTPLVEVTIYGSAKGEASYVEVKFLRGGKPVVEEAF